MEEKKVGKKSKFEEMEQKAKKYFSYESLFEKTKNKKFALTFTLLLRLEDRASEKERTKLCFKMFGASKKRTINFERGIYYLGVIASELFKPYSRPLAYFFVNNVEKAYRYCPNGLKQFLAHPAVVERLKTRALRQHKEPECAALLAYLYLYDYGVTYDNEGMKEIASVLQNARSQSEYFGMSAEKALIIAEGEYGVILQKIRALKEQGEEAERRGDLEEAISAYFSAAKYADKEAMSAYVRLYTLQNKDMPDGALKSKYHKSFRKAMKALKKCKTLAEKLAILQPFLKDDYIPAVSQAKLEYQRAGDDTKYQEMLDRITLLGGTIYGLAAHRDNLSDYPSLTHEDEFYKYLVIEMTKIVRNQGKLVDGFHVDINGYLFHQHVEQLMKYSFEEEFFEADDGIAPVTLTEAQKERVFAWNFRLALEGGASYSLFAMSNVARMYNEGFFVKEDKTRAIAMWQAQYDKHQSREATYYLGRAYVLGDGVERIKTRGAKMLQTLTENTTYGPSAKKLITLSRKDPDKISNEGFTYYDQKDYATALGYFEMAAALGSGIGCRNAGIFYQEGMGVEVDKKKALSYYLKGKSKDVQCPFGAAVLYEEFGDYVSAASCYEACSKMPEQGSDKRHTPGRAALNLAKLYLNGKVDGKQNKLQYLYWMEQAEEKQATIEKEDKKTWESVSPSSQEVLLAFSKIKSSMDTSAYAQFVIEMAIEEGVVGAAEEMGMRYFNGLGVEKDYDKAIEYFKEAVKDIHTNKVEYYLCAAHVERFYEGKGEVLDVVKAQEWFDAAFDYEGADNDVLRELQGIHYYIYAFAKAKGYDNTEDIDFDDCFNNAKEYFLDVYKNGKKRVTVLLYLIYSTKIQLDVYAEDLDMFVQATKYFMESIGTSQRAKKEFDDCLEYQMFYVMSTRLLNFTRADLAKKWIDCYPDSNPMKWYQYAQIYFYPDFKMQNKKRAYELLKKSIDLGIKENDACTFLMKVSVQADSPIYADDFERTMKKLAANGCEEAITTGVGFAREVVKHSKGG